jgi:hypothetical protein
VEERSSGAKNWILRHAQWIAGGIIAVIVAWYLLLRPKSSSGSGAPSVVSFPTSGGGGSSDTSPASAPILPVTLPDSAANDLVSAYLSSQTKLGSAFSESAVWQSVWGALGIPTQIIRQVQAQSDYYTSLTGLNSTTTQLQEWLNQAYAGTLPAAPSKVTPPPPADAGPKSQPLPQVSPQALALNPLLVKGH